MPMMRDTYAALKNAGATDEHATAAAQEVAGIERRLFRLEIMTGLTLAGVVSLVVRAFS